MILLNILVLVFEILYYSMFMYYAKGKGKFKRYLLLFSLITIIGLFIGTNYLYSFIFLIIAILTGLKYIVKIKILFYDLLIIFIMFFNKFIIEILLFYIINVFSNNVYFNALIYGILKFIFVLINKNKIKTLFKNIKIKWDNNIFFIRYIFIIFMFLFVIYSAIYSIGS